MNVSNRMTSKISAKFATNYINSADMFNAKIITNCNRDYFIESQFMVHSDQTVSNTRYLLKCIKNDCIEEVTFFNDESKALAFFENMKFTDLGALIVECCNVERNTFVKITTDLQCSYDNGYTALYCEALYSIIHSYCEGDYLKLHCISNDVYHDELFTYADFYQKNEG